MCERECECECMSNNGLTVGIIVSVGGTVLCTVYDAQYAQFMPHV